MSIAKLLLLNYYPDIRGGNNEVLALLFDMNVLWERFVFVTLHKHLKDTHKVREQVKKEFWQSHSKDYRNVRMAADIVITDKESLSQVFVIDTKWKNMEYTSGPSIEDLRQMYVYHHFYEAMRVALVYPHKEVKECKGVYQNGREGDMCYLIHLGVGDSIQHFEERIREVVRNWIDRK